MVKKHLFLADLARVAQIKADAELRRYAAYRRQFDAVVSRRDALRARLTAIYDHGQAFSIAEARLASIEAGRAATGMAQMEAEINQMRPGLEVVRAKAAREFGRVQALQRLSEITRDRAKLCEE